MNVSLVQSESFISTPSPPPPRNPPVAGKFRKEFSGAFRCGCSATRLFRRRAVRGSVKRYVSSCASTATPRCRPARPLLCPSAVAGTSTARPAPPARPRTPARRWCRCRPSSTLRPSTTTSVAEHEAGLWASAADGGGAVGGARRGVAVANNWSNNKEMEFVLVCITTY